ncbi:MAG: helix-turn-helix transcriptional regulator [Eubacteriales bacterium]|nr:helix-turn-helix transcriptional regulator [Eubacteriales bacterium]
MEEKNKFGAYIREKRNARGLSQKDLASRLYITESAVSKWERGKSYPDITLITLLCEILQVSEHELITASDDVQQRLNEMQARKYRTFTKVMTILMYVMYAAILIPTLLSQIFQHSGELWWPILLSCMALLFSGLTVPTVLAHQNRGWWTLMSFLFSSELLTFSVWLYQRSVRAASFTGGFALLTGFVGVLFGYFVVFAPLALRLEWFPEHIRRSKVLISLAGDSILLLALELLAAAAGGSAVSTIGKMLAITAYCLSPVWGIAMFLRYASVNKWLRTAFSVAVGGLFVFLANNFVNWILLGDWRHPWFGFSGTAVYRQAVHTMPAADAVQWANNVSIFSVMLCVCGAAALAFLLIGLLRGEAGESRDRVRGKRQC